MADYVSRNLYFSLFVASFFLLYILGPIFGFVINAAGYYKPLDVYVLGQAAVFFALFVMTVACLKGFARRQISLSIGRKFYRPAVYLYPLVIALGSILVYVAQNGIVLRMLSSYEDRYLANIGLGLFSQGMQLFYIFVAGLLIVQKGIPASRVILVSVAYALITFAVLGGHRQLGLGLIVGVLIFFVLEKRVPLYAMGLTIAAFVPISLAMALFRYDLGSQSIDELMVSLLLFFYDGLTPIDAHSTIYQYLQHYDYPGFGVAVNQFLVYVPRFLWVEKPLIVFNGGNFYTFTILGRAGMVTYSPTMLGELLLVHGGCFYLVAPVLGVLVHAVDRSICKRGLLGVTLAIFSFTLCFNLYREGFYVFLSKLVLITAFVKLFELCSRFRVGRRRCHV